MPLLGYWKKKKKKTLLEEDKFEILPYAVKAKIFCKISQIEAIPQYSLNKRLMNSVSGIVFRHQDYKDF